jgi:hypothetical protein
MQAGLVQFFARAAYQGEETLYAQFVEPVAQMMLSIVEEMLTQAAARGEVRPDVDIEATARVINATMLAVGDSQLLPYLNRYLLVNDDNLPFARVVEALLDLILDGIASEGAQIQVGEAGS